MIAAPRFPHIMLDLETAATVPGAAIRSIGAVAFEFRGRPLGPAHYANVSLESCDAIGLIIDPDTMAWWAEHPEAEAALADDQQSLPSALLRFAGFVEEHGTDEVCLWSHGAGFDLPIIEHAMRATGITVPWKFRNCRDTRTMLWLAEQRGFTIPVDRQGLRHQALDDAKTMALRMIEAFGGIMR
jgi:hypothetical protein